MSGANATKRRGSPPKDFDYLFAAGAPIRHSAYSLTSNVDRLIQSVEAERIADKIFADADIFHLMGRSPSSAWNDYHFDLLDAPIPIESRYGSHMRNIPLLSNPLLSDYYLMSSWSNQMSNVPNYPYPSTSGDEIMAGNGEKHGKNERSSRQRQQSDGHVERGHGDHPRPRRNDAKHKKDGLPRPQKTRSNPKDYSDFDLSQLKLDEPAPEIVSELPSGHGVTIVGTRLANGEVTTRIKYDRHLMLALSHSPFSLAQPDNYPQIVREMDEIIPVYPRRYIPREFLPKEATSCSSEGKSEA